METYKFGSYEEAIAMLQNLKRSGEPIESIVFTIDFAKNEDVKKRSVSPEEGYSLIKSSETIIINADSYVPHIQLFSIKQPDLENIIRDGIMHDIIFVAQKT